MTIVLYVYHTFINLSGDVSKPIRISTNAECMRMISSNNDQSIIIICEFNS